MQNPKWPCYAGADHWNVCVGHNGFVNPGSGELQVLASCGAVSSVVLDIWLWQWRRDLYLGYFAVWIATRFEFHFLYRVGARAEKHDHRNLAVNADVVPAVVEILCCNCRRFPVVRYFPWNKG